mmetsp:Transcript_13051/g.18164  ORF Transcript_13051/g.18164 Transcript_13051/m.18164 type:complete len:103 (-) Transcript_13051:748-1056(-)
MMEKEEEEGKQPTNNLNLLQTETHSNFFTSCFEFQDNKQPFENMASPHPIDRSLLNCTDAKTITAFLATLSLSCACFAAKIKAQKDSKSRQQLQQQQQQQLF